MLLARNRQALYNYEVVEKITAGLVLRGYEVKAIKESNVNLTGSYVILEEGEAFVTNMLVGRYSKLSQQISEFDLTRPRKLLLNKKELYKLQKHLAEKGKTAVPLALLLQHNLVKLEFALVKGKKEFEKKIVEKERQIKKDLETAIKTNKRSAF